MDKTITLRFSKAGLEHKGVRAAPARVADLDGVVAGGQQEGVVRAERNSTHVTAVTGQLQGIRASVAVSSDVIHLRQV